MSLHNNNNRLSIDSSVSNDRSHHSGAPDSVTVTDEEKPKLSLPIADDSHEVLSEVKALTAYLLGFLRDNNTLNCLKGTDELLLKLEEISREIEEHTENIMVTMEHSQTVSYNMHNLLKSLNSLKIFLNGRPRISFFSSKSKMQKQIQDFYQTIRAKCTQLMTSVSLELLVERTKVSISPQIPVIEVGSAGKRAHILLQEGEALLIGNLGRVQNRPLAMQKIAEAIDQGSIAAMLVKAKDIRKRVALRRGYEKGKLTLNDADDEDEVEDEDEAEALLTRILNLPRGEEDRWFRIQAQLELADLLIGQVQREKNFDWKRVKWIPHEDQHHSSDEELDWQQVDVVIQTDSSQGESNCQSRLQRAVDMLLFNAGQGVVPAMTQLGLGFLQVRNGKFAAQWLSLAASRGCSLASVVLGKMLLENEEELEEHEQAPEEAISSHERDKRKSGRALNLFRMAYKAGQPVALLGIGICCERGLGVSRDLHKALRLYRRAVHELGPHLEVSMSLWWSWAGQHGYKYTLYRLGRVAAEISLSEYPQRPSSSVPAENTFQILTVDQRRLLSEGVKYLRLAEDRGVAAASYQLGRLCEQGLVLDPYDVDLNSKLQQATILSQRLLALDHYRKAARLGHHRAALCAGHILYVFLGQEEEDLRPLTALYRQAAEGGLAEAQNCLGLLLEDGRAQIGGSDKVAAATWYIESVRLGYEPAALNLSLLLCSDWEQDKQRIPVRTVDILAGLKHEEMTVNQVREWLFRRIRSHPSVSTTSPPSTWIISEEARRAVEAMLLNSAQEHEFSNLDDGSKSHTEMIQQNQHVEEHKEKHFRNYPLQIDNRKTETGATHQIVSYTTAGPIVPPTYVPKAPLPSAPSAAQKAPEPKTMQASSHFTGVSLATPEILT